MIRNEFGKTVIQFGRNQFPVRKKPVWSSEEMLIRSGENAKSSEISSEIILTRDKKKSIDDLPKH